MHRLNCTHIREIFTEAVDDQAWTEARQIAVLIRITEATTMNTAFKRLLKEFLEEEENDTAD